MISAIATMTSEHVTGYRRATSPGLSDGSRTSTTLRQVSLRSLRSPRTLPGVRREAVVALQALGFAGIAGARHSGADRLAGKSSFERSVGWRAGAQQRLAETMLGCVAFTERGARQMRSLGFGRYVLCSCVVAAMLADCGAAQPPIGAPGVSQKRGTTSTP
jgi:hypothetical protein